MFEITYIKYIGEKNVFIIIIFIYFFRKMVPSKKFTFDLL